MTSIADERKMFNPAAYKGDTACVYANKLYYEGGSQCN
jgi:hypothetical protein